MNTELLKTLVRLKDKWLRLIVIDESVPDGSREYQFLPRQFFLGLVALLASVLIVFMLMLMFTPLGEWVYRSKESQINMQIEQVVGRLDALQDSLDVRDEQLGQIRSIIRLNTDTTLSLDERLQSLLLMQNQTVLGGVAAHHYAPAVVVPGVRFLEVAAHRCDGAVGCSLAQFRANEDSGYSSAPHCLTINRGESHTQRPRSRGVGLAQGHGDTHL